MSDMVYIFGTMLVILVFTGLEVLVGAVLVLLIPKLRTPAPKPEYLHYTRRNTDEWL